MKLGELVQLRPDPGVDDLGDGALAAACATGDHAAQSLLFERHVDAVYRFLSRMAGGDVDDLVQATFLAAFRSAGSFRGARLQSWLYGIAANVVRTHVRKESSRRRVVDAFALEPVRSVDHPTPAGDLAKLNAAIARLPTKLREVIALVDLEGESGPDAARALRISEPTVWRRLAAARKALREALA